MLSDNDVDFEYLVGDTLPAEYVETLVEQPDALEENDEEEQTEEESDADEDEDPCNSIELRDEDTNEIERVKRFLETTCGCQLQDGSSCSREFSFEKMINYRADMLQLTKSEMDLVLLTCIRNSMNNSEINAKGEKRKNHRILLQFSGRRICEKTFLFLRAVGKSKFRALITYYKINETIVARTHGNGGRKPWNALTFEATCKVKKFLINYANIHALLLPGRYPAFKIQLLESHVTKKKNS